ncbi:hypothetical protein AKJ09_09420 [Labilithrix luteola]|uniref:Uncharacterized protein n=1 Tax=Labilithrix luteola TaxID=1391654 RepID=A0A0K1QAS2_9BACT|nr:hypothetical protein [Labilithrix luteola]AKV02757.1 hypothetical protein AKJ09_09420 [Labilithrix luteola]
MRRAGLLVALLAVSCATTGAEGEGDRDLPSVGVGPFRKLADAEVPSVAPFLLEGRGSNYREPAVLDDHGDTLLYAVARRDDGADVIVRTRATDGRAFFGAGGDIGHSPAVVLVPDAPWEGGALGGPFAVRVGQEIWLYYAAAGGIGLARSSDGFSFHKEPGPIFVADPNAARWEQSPVRAPSVVVLPDGRFRLFYASGVSIGEAESTDGLRFRRLDADVATAELDPVLAPSAPPAPGSLAPHEKPPFDMVAVSDPSASLRTTSAGRLLVRVLYTGVTDSAVTAIGYAGRFGDTGPLTRNPVPVYSVHQGEAAPALMDRGETSMLYVQQIRRGTSDTTYPAVAGAVAPVTVTLPAPADFPDSP